MKDEEFFKAYEARENETTDDFIARHSATEAELRDVIVFLIQHRSQMRDCEIEKLEHETKELLKKLAENKRQILVEELACFKETLALHKRLLESR